MGPGPRPLNTKFRKISILVLFLSGTDVAMDVCLSVQNLKVPKRIQQGFPTLIYVFIVQGKAVEERSRGEA
jgi:hypothetical protein